MRADHREQSAGLAIEAPHRCQYDPFSLAHYAEACRRGRYVTIVVITPEGWGMTHFSRSLLREPDALKLVAPLLLRHCFRALAGHMPKPPKWLRTLAEVPK